MVKLAFLLSFFLCSLRAFASECLVGSPFVKVIICQGHSLIEMNVPEHGRLTNKFRGFYPPGRIEDEVGERLYTLEDLKRCQSVCQQLTREQALDLDIFFKKTTFALENQGSKLADILNRTTVYDMKRFNCVDFSQMILSRYSNQSLVKAFASQNKPLTIYSDDLEPCFGGRNPPECLQWGADKAAFWAYYREGVPYLLAQIYFHEKPFILLINMVSVGACVCKNSVNGLFVFGMSSAAIAFARALMNYELPKQSSPAEWVFPQLLLSTAEILGAVVQKPFPEPWKRFSWMLPPLILSSVFAYLSGERDDISKSIESFDWKGVKL